MFANTTLYALLVSELASFTSRLTYSVTESDLKNRSPFLCKLASNPGVCVSELYQTSEQRYARYLWKILDLGRISSIEVLDD